MHLSNASPEQLAIVEASEQKLLVLAAAGSGKTRTLVWRIAYLIEEGNLDPRLMVAITFTNVAADELKRRLEAMGIRIGFVGTLHAFALRHIAQHGHKLGYKGMPTILSEEEAIDRRKATLKKLKLPASTTLQSIDEAIGIKGTSNAHLCALQYRKDMRADNAVDFTLILAEFATLLAADGLFLDALFVDEYQDSSQRDARIYDMITAAADFRVGDADQSMYSFRGGLIDNILRLSREWKTYRLPTNYRSARSIIATANRLMDEDGRRERMESFRREEGVVTLKEYPNVLTEAASVAAFIRHSGRPASDFAVLTRYNARADAVRAALASEGVAVRKLAKPTLSAETMTKLGMLARAPELYPGTPAGQQMIFAGIPMDEIRIVGDHWKGSFDETILALTMAEEEASGEGVHVGTVHSLKGGEKPVVFVLGMESHTWPGKKAGEDRAEERRVAYVAFTRAQDELHVSWSRQAPDSGGFGMIEATPSPFTACIKA